MMWFSFAMDFVWDDSDSKSWSWGIRIPKGLGGCEKLGEREHRRKTACPMISRETSQLYLATNIKKISCTMNMHRSNSIKLGIRIIDIHMTYVILCSYPMAYLTFLYRYLVIPMDPKPSWWSQCLLHAMLQRRQLCLLRELLLLQPALPLQRGLVGLAPLPRTGDPGGPL